MAIEIEKKYLITRIPNEITFESESKIYQTYLATGEEELRIRKIIKNGTEKHTLTIKQGSGLTRKEFETQISLSTYDQLLSATMRKPLIKTRKVAIITCNNEQYTVEIDIYENIDNLIVAEVEFDSEVSAKQFQEPIWFGQDVTEDKNYKNQKLWEKVQAL